MRGVKSQPHGATHQPFVGVRSELADWVRSLLLKDAGVVSLSSPLQCCLPHSPLEAGPLHWKWEGPVSYRLLSISLLSSTQRCDVRPVRLADHRPVTRIVCVPVYGVSRCTVGACDRVRPCS